VTDFDHAYHTQPYQSANPYQSPQSSARRQPSPVDPPPARGRRRPLVVALVTVLLLGAVGYGLWLLT
jgi:hypothetical protein